MKYRKNAVFVFLLVCFCGILAGPDIDCMAQEDCVLDSPLPIYKNRRGKYVVKNPQRLIIRVRCKGEATEMRDFTAFDFLRRRGEAYIGQDQFGDWRITTKYVDLSHQRGWHGTPSPDDGPSGSNFIGTWYLKNNWKIVLREDGGEIWGLDGSDNLWKAGILERVKISDDGRCLTAILRWQFEEKGRPRGTYGIVTGTTDELNLCLRGIQSGVIMGGGLRDRKGLAMREGTKGGKPNWWRGP